MLLGALVVVVAHAAGADAARGRRSGRAGGPRPTRPRRRCGERLRNRNFYLLALGSMASIGAVGGAIQHFKMMLTLDQGWTQAEALNIVSMIAAVSLVGRFGAGWLADKIGPKRVMLIVYAAGDRARC